MYKVGDKVEYCGEVVEITQIFDSGNCMVSNGTLEAHAHLSYLDKHKSAHEKLIEMGWEYSQLSEDKDDHYYELHDEYVWFSISNKNYRLSNGLEVTLELSRILTQYLEELE